MLWTDIRGAIRDRWQAKTEHPDCVVATIRGRGSASHVFLRVLHSRARAEVLFLLDLAASDGFAAREVMACAQHLALGKVVVENGRWLLRYVTPSGAVSDDELPGILATLEEEAVGLRVRLLGSAMRLGA